MTRAEAQNTVKGEVGGKTNWRKYSGLLRGWYADGEGKVHDRLGGKDGR